MLFRGDERIYFSYLLHSKFPGQLVKGEILRAGERLEIDITLNLYKPLVPKQLYDTSPK